MNEAPSSVRGNRWQDRGCFLRSQQFRQRSEASTNHFRKATKTMSLGVKGCFHVHVHLREGRGLRCQGVRQVRGFSGSSLRV